MFALECKSQDRFRLLQNETGCLRSTIEKALYLRKILMETTPPNLFNKADHPKYRPDIDGLRAIAVLSVVGYHAFPQFIKGGFVGVDIFFVISGFLISSIIFSGLDNGGFSFIRFYQRRVLRIFPSLLFVLSVCFIFGWYSLLSDELKQLGKHMAGGAGFVSNILLWHESGYFDDIADNKPLLHLWSLGVEEQFYIIWPLVLWAGWRKGLNLLTVAIAIAVSSFVINIVYVNGDITKAFFLPQARFWEMLLGAILAYKTLHRFPVSAGAWLDRLLRLVIYSHSSVEEGATLRNVQSILGTTLLILGFLTTTKSSLFPGYLALFPTVGAVLIISAGKAAWINQKVLSSKILVWVGLISFPLYLWHWPLLSFARILTSGTTSIEARFGIVFLALALSWVTYRFVERPLRFGKRGRGKSVFLVLFGLFLGGVGGWVYINSGFPFRIGNSDQTANERIQRHGGFFYGGARNCSDIFRPLIKDSWCAKSDGDPLVAVIGDSHAGQLFLGVRDSSDAVYKNVIFMGAGACYPTMGKDSREGCGRQLQLALDIVENTKSIKDALN